MASAQPLHATFFAFRKRAQQGVLFRLSAAFVVALALIWGIYLLLFHEAVASLFNFYLYWTETAAQGAWPEPGTLHIPTGAGIAVIGFLPIVIVQYFVLASYESGCLRWLVRGEVSGFMGFTFGADMWRVWGVYWIWFGLHLVASIIFGTFAYIVTQLSGGPESASGDIASRVWSIVQECIIIYLSVRLSPAAAVSVGRKRFAFFDAWRVTEGRFWALLGAFVSVLAILCGVAVIAFGGAVTFVYGHSAQSIVAAAKVHDVRTMMQLALAPFHSPGALLLLGCLLLANQALSMVFYVMFYGINARAVVAAADDGKIELPGIPAAATVS